MPERFSFKKDNFSQVKLKYKQLHVSALLFEK
jgi:hypothetical protein